jgi:hypothetical protein
VLTEKPHFCTHFNAMKQFVIFFFVLFPSFLNAQEKFTISGYIKDAASGETQIGATVVVKELGSGTTTNQYGFYSLSLPKGEYTIVYSFIGYQSITRNISLQQNQKLNIDLKSVSQELGEVVVTGERKTDNVEKTEMSTVNLKMETINKIPALMGEVDIIRAIQLLPGVTTGGEGSTGFFVRGGGADQNMVLLDEAPVYNASHLMGFFSVFNQDAIKDVQLYKGGIPAQFGGRLSSVLDVRMKEGNNKKTVVSGGIGTLASRLTVEAPIVKDKGSFIISGRRNYADVFLKFAPNEDLRKNQLYFFDLNGKVNYTINDKNTIYLSAYTGRDVFKIGDLFGMSWGNKTFTARWNKLISDKLFSNLTFVHSNFDYNLGVPQGITAFNWKSSIIDYSVKNDYTLFLNPKNKVSFGLISTYHTFKPAEVNGLGRESVINSFQLPNNYALEHAAYIGNEQALGTRWNVQYGMRYSLFQNTGEATVYQYNGNFDTTGVVKYPKGEIFNAYGGFEPRLGIRYLLNDVSSLKASYNKTRQYLHLASNSTNASPIDVWIPSSPNVKPQIADQVALGYFRNLRNNEYEVSVEGYYKKMQNQIDYADHARILFNPLLEGEIRTGNAEAYGLEFLIRKQEGKFNGWIAYTLSRVFRTIPAINDGKPYPATFDRPHNLSVVLSYDMNKRVNFATNWVYYTGAAITAPTGRFEYMGMVAPVYSDRNGARLPDYHRLDLSATINGNPNKRYQGSWVFSVYNAYYRKNAFSILFRQNKDNPQTTEAVKLYFFAIVPSVTYNFKF